MSETPKLLNVAQVAQTLGVSTRHVRRQVDAGNLPAPVKIGTSIRWNAEAIYQWISAGCPKPRRDA